MRAALPRKRHSVASNPKKLQDVFVASRTISRIVLFLLLVLQWTSAVAIPPVNTSASLKKVQATSVLLVDAASGKVLFERNPNKPLPPASTVKLLTALLVYERTGLKGEVVVQKADTLVEPSHIPLQTGETVAVKTLVQSLLIGSDNDSAMALARHTSGSVEKFVALMNARARELGCTNSLFKNPNGLPAPGQVTTACDLLRIFQAAMAVPELREICRTPSITLKTAAGVQTIKNHNKLLGVYPGMGPAKTGWTFSSKHTFAASATREGRELHLILLHSANKWADTKAVLDFGFERVLKDANK
ncbi:MAG TPA: D-alanyl-D-alanine carboxypeptidase family protein [Verrucomicrobiae bacterium]|nr:D-alanyl-D-alanine carboxypeptidase family protein [Verrucomicrobiae bacterium]